MRASVRSALVASLEDGAAFAAAADGPYRRALRRHPRRGELGPWREVVPVPWSPLGVFHAADEDPGGSLDLRTGAAYAQDAASQLPSVVLAPQPGEVVVDCCAAPGSKSTQLGLMLGDEGLLVCCDRSPPRRRTLVQALSWQGVSAAVVTPMAPERLAERHPGAADAVLVDAPCTGQRDASERQSIAMGERQVRLLRAVAPLVRPGGRLVYSTCTPSPFEDEAVIARFLALESGWSVTPAAGIGCDADLEGLGALRLWPHRQGTEPFFVCRLARAGDASALGFPGDSPAPAQELGRWLEGSALACWRRGEALLAGTPAAAACALPTEARGCLLAQGNRLTPWGAQFLIERGAAHERVSRAEAITLWAGAPSLLSAGTLVATHCGGPLGVVASQGRLDISSGLCASGLR